MLHRLNAYRIMWLFVYFDLPTKTKKERKEYRLFREGLENDGFNMLQYSIYTRHCMSREDAEKHKKRVKEILPPHGHIIIHTITDKQFGMMENFYSAKKKKTKNPQYEQLTMF